MKSKITKILFKMMEKANTDKQFGALALADFGKAFKEFTKFDLPEGATFEFEKQGNLIVVKTPEGELSDEELESVAGGKGLPKIPDMIAPTISTPPSQIPGFKPDPYITSAYACPTAWDTILSKPIV